MSQPDRKTQPKKARSKGESQPQALLDPPQIKKFIRRYFRAQPEQGDALWSLILGNDDLFKAWKVYAKAGIGQDFWEARWHRDLRLEAEEWSAVSEMRQNRHQLMRLCHYSLILSLACDVFAAIDSLPEDKAAQVSHLEDALLSRAGEKMGELMDAGCSAAEFWPPDNWWMYQVWGDIAVKLAGTRDPIRVAQWMADVNALVAARCLTESGHNLNLKELDPNVLDLGAFAFRELTTLTSSQIAVLWSDRAGLSALIARLANPDRPTTMERLTYVVERHVPEVFRSAAYDWLRIISDEDLKGFFESLSSDALWVCAEQYPSLKPGDRTKPLILYIEDYPEMHELTRLIFSRAFREQVLVISVIGGSAGGLILASMLLPDLVLTDINEPGMRGWEFATYLKKRPITQNVPLVFVTAHAQPEDIQRGMELGARDYVTKPFSPQDLVAVIQDVLGIEGHWPT